MYNYKIAPFLYVFSECYWNISSVCIYINIYADTDGETLSAYAILARSVYTHSTVSGVGIAICIVCVTER